MQLANTTQEVYRTFTVLGPAKRVRVYWDRDVPAQCTTTRRSGGVSKHDKSF
jgi:hypothetical protein